MEKTMKVNFAVLKTSIILSLDHGDFAKCQISHLIQIGMFIWTFTLKLLNMKYSTQNQGELNQI